MQQTNGIFYRCLWLLSIATGHLHIVKELISQGSRGWLNLSLILKRNKKGLSGNSWIITVQVYCQFFQVKANRYWLLWSTRILKKVEQRSTTMSHFEYGRICDRRVFMFWTTGKWGIKSLLMKLFWNTEGSISFCISLK